MFNLRAFKKRGDSLIELIVAMAIFSIGITAASLTLTTAFNIWNKDNISLSMVAFNQSISQQLIGKGKTTISNFYNNDLKYKESSTGYGEYYIYFNNNIDLSAILINRTPINFYEVSLIDTLGTTVPVSKYDDCMLHKPANKRYGALIYIKDKKTDLSLYYSLFEVDSYAWDFYNGKQTESFSEFEIGSD